MIAPPQTAPALRHRGHTAGADDPGGADHGDGGAPAAEAEQDQGQGGVHPREPRLQRGQVDRSLCQWRDSAR